MIEALQRAVELAQAEAKAQLAAANIREERERSKAAHQRSLAEHLHRIADTELRAEAAEKQLAIQAESLRVAREEVERLREDVIREVAYRNTSRDDRERAESRVRELEAALRAAQGLIFAHHDVAKMQKFEAGDLCPACVPNGNEDPRVDQIAKAAHGIQATAAPCPDCESKAREIERLRIALKEEQEVNAWGAENDKRAREERYRERLDHAMLAFVAAGYDLPVCAENAVMAVAAVDEIAAKREGVV